MSICSGSGAIRSLPMPAACASLLRTGIGCYEGGLPPGLNDVPGPGRAKAGRGKRGRTTTLLQIGDTSLFLVLIGTGNLRPRVAGREFIPRRLKGKRAGPWERAELIGCEPR